MSRESDNKVEARGAPRKLVWLWLWKVAVGLSTVRANSLPRDPTQTLKYTKVGMAYGYSAARLITSNFLLAHR